MKTLEQFITEQQIVRDAQRVPRNPNIEQDKWAREARHWFVTLTIVGRGMRTAEEALEVYFSQGSAHTKAPTAADVLDSLASAAQSVDSAQDFEDWAQELGYDTDSRKAEATYHACVRQAKDLKRFLGHKAYAELLYEVERL